MNRTESIVEYAALTWFGELGMVRNSVTRLESARRCEGQNPRDRETYSE